MSWRERVGQLLASQSELDAGQERLEVERQNTVPVSSCRNRQRVAISGVIRSVTYSPVSGAPELRAELYDGSGTIDLIWLGRRAIPGIDPGRRLRAEGMLSRTSPERARPAIYNPSYRILPSQAVS
ncbi:OB-fold nucleic acid binding domain-containing protein [Ruania halotolerans]|uniref:OB-fold nucleic acid binding domain-containing protein n=1 Tax=Ruania halotolerans TaxID=2897773 RepID=UPI001E5A27EC|nr:OB-fold nucleic acid binding domain-containing protein [Ruania halotolerans]UFU04802.1 OB-fold nucleic acid binding domain-containing protein [Ruania halotolerans]